MPLDPAGPIFNTGPMSRDADFVTHLLDLLEAYENVTARRMFGGHGVHRDGRMFGLVADGVFYLKTDERNRSTFQDAGLEAFQYEGKSGAVVVMSYFRCPDAALENPSAMRPWAESAMAAAARAPLPRKQSTKRKSAG